MDVKLDFLSTHIVTVSLSLSHTQNIFSVLYIKDNNEQGKTIKIRTFKVHDPKNTRTTLTL